MHGLLYPRYYDNLLISVIYFSLKENEERDDVACTLLTLEFILQNLASFFHSCSFNSFYLKE